jgi:hypothetical protein
VEAFEALLRDPKASAERAYRWMFFGGAVGSTTSALISFFRMDAQLGSTYGVPTTPVLDTACSLGIGLLQGLGMVLGRAICVGIMHLIARALGGTGKYAELVYACAAFIAPLTIMVGVVSGIPYVNLLLIPLVIAVIVLYTMAVKAVHRFGWGKAVGVSLVAVTLSLILNIAGAVLRGSSL